MDRKDKEIVWIDKNLATTRLFDGYLYMLLTGQQRLALRPAELTYFSHDVLIKWSRKRGRWRDKNKLRIALVLYMGREKRLDESIFGRQERTLTYWCTFINDRHSSRCFSQCLWPIFKSTGWHLSRRLRCRIQGQKWGLEPRFRGSKKGDKCWKIYLLV